MNLFKQSSGCLGCQMGGHLSDKMNEALFQAIKLRLMFSIQPPCYKQTLKNILRLIIISSCYAVSSCFKFHRVMLHVPCRSSEEPYWKSGSTFGFRCRLALNKKTTNLWQTQSTMIIWKNVIFSNLFWFAFFPILPYPVGNRVFRYIKSDLKS